MGNYKLSSRATVDISDIYMYGINKFGVKLSKSYVLELHQNLNLLIKHKELWRPAFYIKNGLFKYSYKSHIIFFVEDEHFVFISRILHKTMDFRSHL
ncbi:type II toxin-antitoxin system RelE/ParE family toxin [Flavobacteriaceae bacterium 14752]|uniref:type II toxin-antitoxin system RelE/ParE family toxin n=1 Tax=Mesohalobacter salilacus TaxID=2491711 RepID=UPI000F636F00|nr:type II toxin-antitoxin system RelE/ParE family toxin [Flavobacteriaceae bacterium 14752]